MDNILIFVILFTFAAIFDSCCKVLKRWIASSNGRTQTSYVNGKIATWSLFFWMKQIDAWPNYTWTCRVTLQHSIVWYIISLCIKSHSWSDEQSVIMSNSDAAASITHNIHYKSYQIGLDESGLEDGLDLWTELAGQRKFIHFWADQNWRGD